MHLRLTAMPVDAGCRQDVLKSSLGTQLEFLQPLAAQMPSIAMWLVKDDTDFVALQKLLRTTIPIGARVQVSALDPCHVL